MTGRLLISLLLVAFFPVLGQAALKTFVEPRLVDEMDTIRLTIRKEGSNQSDPPDLTPLDANFEVLGSQTSSRISSINGRTMASVEYQISLRPRRTGELTVPSIDIGGEQSEAIIVRVRPMDPAIMEAIGRMVFFETELSTNPVYVQAETVLTRRLYYSQGVQIYSDLPGTPEIENAVVIPLGETQSRSVDKGGQRYGVIEQRFALFPEQSGALTIPAISVTSSVRLQSQGRSRRSGIRVSTEELELTVKPIPPSYPADVSWLPARDVSVSQRWVPDRTDIEVGDPLTFEIDIEAEGNRGSAIPPMPLPLPADQFRIYPEAPRMAESADSGTVVGTRQETFALIPTRPGPVAVPELSITWWDTQSDRLRQTGIDVAAMTVTGQPTAGTGDAAAVPETSDSSPEKIASEPDTPLVTSPAPVWPALAGGLLTVTLAAILFWLMRRYAVLFDGILSSLYDRFPGLDRRPARTRRQLTKALLAAGGHSDLTHFRQALVDYLCNLYDLPPGAALQRFRQVPEAREALFALEQASFAPEGSRDAPDTVMLTALARAEAKRCRAQTQEPELPALYG